MTTTTTITTENALLDTQTTEPVEKPISTALVGKRANWTIAHKIEGETITWQVKGAGSIALDMRKLSEAVKAKAMVHGMIQRVSDAAAMARDAKTGQSATAQEKFEAMSRLVEHYQSGSGEWSPQRSASGSGPRGNPQSQLLVMALLIHAPNKGSETIEKFVKGLTVAQVAALVMSKELREAIELAREELREKEAKMAEAAGVKVEELLSGL